MSYPTEEIANELRRSEIVVRTIYASVVKKLQLTGNEIQDFAKISVGLFKEKDSEKFALNLIELIEEGLEEEYGREVITRMREVFKKWIRRAMDREVLNTLLKENSTEIEGNYSKELFLENDLEKNKEKIDNYFYCW